ncbi:hypothetical protein LTR85_003873 [Meristemomyces frigidus]|nr:hypothetical protein LTR85_003873 [Meristemomyces frigidus]
MEASTGASKARRPARGTRTSPAKKHLPSYNDSVASEGGSVGVSKGRYVSSVVPDNDGKATRKRTIHSFAEDGTIIDHELPASKLPKIESRSHRTKISTAASMLDSKAESLVEPATGSAVLEKPAQKEGEEAVKASELPDDTEVHSRPAPGPTPWRKRELVSNKLAKDPKDLAQQTRIMELRIDKANREISWRRGFSGNVSFDRAKLLSDLPKAWAQHEITAQIAAALAMPTSSDERVQAQIAALEHKLKTAVSGFDILTNNISGLCQQEAALPEEKDKLLEDKVRLTEANAALVKENEGLRKLDKRDLLRDVNDLQKNNRHIARNNAALNGQVTSLEEKNAKLMKELSVAKASFAQPAGTLSTGGNVDRQQTHPLLGVVDKDMRLAEYEKIAEGMATIIDRERAKNERLEQKLADIEGAQTKAGPYNDTHRRH